MSRFKRQEKKDSRQLSDVDSDSEWESDGVSLSDGPIQLAEDPSAKYRTEEKEEKQRKPNPQRVWEPERHINISVNPQQTNNVPYQSQGYGGHSFAPVSTNTGHHCRNMANNAGEKKVTKKRSYHVSTIGEDGEEIFEEQIVNEDGVQVLHNTSFKKKIKQQRLEELKDEEDLMSMKRKIATRFLLSKCHPRMTIGSVEKHLREHFDIDDVYVRRNPDRHDWYSSFIFILNSDEELDIREFERHKWPGEIRCFFAPRDRHARQ